MGSPSDGRASCPGTGLTVPECSCRNCLEEMLHRFRPELLGGDQIRISRTGAHGEQDQRSNIEGERLS